MAEDNNGDVDRAMAAFAASPMRYFTAAPLAPSDAASLSGSETSGQHAARAEHVAAFPLLIAALPGISQAPMPLPPNGVDSASGRARAVASEAKKAELLTRRARALYQPVAQPPKKMSAPPAPPPTATVPNLSAVFGLPVRHASATQVASKPTSAAHTSDIRATPIATMFDALHAAGSSHDEAAEASSRLQDIFGRL